MAARQEDEADDDKGNKDIFYKSLNSVKGSGFVMGRKKGDDSI
jgi:hypothetical protein